MNIYDQGNKIVIEPLPKDLIQEGRGILKTKGRVLKRLMNDQKGCPGLTHLFPEDISNYQNFNRIYIAEILFMC